MPKSDIVGSSSGSILSFWGTSILISTVDALAYIPTKIV
jgi:hypothetical protein